MLFIIGISNGQKTSINESIDTLLALDSNRHYSTILSSHEETYSFLLDATKESPVTVVKATSLKAHTLSHYGRYTHFEYTTVGSEVQKCYSSLKMNQAIDYLTAQNEPYYCNKINQEAYGIFDADNEACEKSLFLQGKYSFKELYMTHHYTDVKYLTSSYIPLDVPCLSRTIKFIIPPWLKMDVIPMNLPSYDVLKKDTLIGQTHHTLVSYQFNNILPAYYEDNSVGSSHYIPHLAFVFKSYMYQKEKYPLFEKIQDQYNWYSMLLDQVNNDTLALRPYLTKIIEGKSTEKEQIEAVFYWIQDNIRYVAMENGIKGFRPAAADKVCHDKYGDCKGVSNLAKQMLRMLGLDARLAWIGTHHISADYNYNFPSLANDNHMICALRWKNQIYYLDPTENHIQFGELASRIQGRVALIENGDTYLLDTLPVYPDDHNREIENINVQLKKDTLSCIGIKEYSGESKTLLNRFLFETEKSKIQSHLISFLTDGNRNMKVDTIYHNASNHLSRDEKMVFNYHYLLKNQLIKTPNQLYINLNFDGKIPELEIDSTRKTPLNIDFKKSYDHKISFTIPKGYEISYAPRAVTYYTPDFSINYAYTWNENQIILNKKITFHHFIVRNQYFNEWSLMKDKRGDFCKEYLILNKK